MPSLAIDGGSPVRRQILPYGRQLVEEDDIAAVAAVLRSDWLTTGPAIDCFEQAFSDFVGEGDAVAVNSGTAALHAAMFALGIGPGDEVIVPAMTFAASANCVLYQGGTPVFADVDPATLLIDPGSVDALMSERTRAVICVDYAGQPADYAGLEQVTAKRGVALVADACHSLGARDRSRPVGTLGALSAFSLHPVKHITSGEGGVITTGDPALATRLRLFRNHGISTDHRQRAGSGSWHYEMVELGYNLRMTDFQAALAQSQLRKLPAWIERRRSIAQEYDAAFAGVPGILPLTVRPTTDHAYHLYVILLDTDRLRADRNEVFRALRAEGIGVNVHYIPVHLHPYYRQRLGTTVGQCPVAEAAFQRILSLPIFPAMSRQDVADVVASMDKVIRHFIA